MQWYGWEYIPSLLNFTKVLFSEVEAFFFLFFSYLTLTTNTLLYAQYTSEEIEEKFYTITYQDGAGGTVFADDIHLNCKENTLTPAYTGGTPSRTGYTFTGWKPAVPPTVTAHATLVAQWKKNSVSPTKPEPSSPSTPDTSYEGSVTQDQNSNDILRISPSEEFQELRLEPQTPPQEESTQKALGGNSPTTPLPKTGEATRPTVLPILLTVLILGGIVTGLLILLQKQKR